MVNPSSSSQVPGESSLARYKNRIVLVLGVAQGERSKIQWLTEDGESRISAVKRKNLHQMQPQLF
ncbi:hypothetical protein A8H39_01755 [Paraburkholderia fungorum]|uniref:hypothetical protein n=1 Tax=Paraburkholderia fungorum TaxID=134537 RepID=UPI000698CD5E|nr:hypothetical protein [Paraburkholderia fungorum]PNE59896.1 hypothetical protein A8H39_01755 [Paraburkholderia fungorum]